MEKKCAFFAAVSEYNNSTDHTVTNKTEDKPEKTAEEVE